MAQMEYKIGALNQTALELLESKGLEKYKFKSYSQVFRIVDKLNDYFRCRCFRVVDVIEYKKVR